MQVERKLRASTVLDKKDNHRLQSWLVGTNYEDFTFGRSKPNDLVSDHVLSNKVRVLREIHTKLIETAFEFEPYRKTLYSIRKKNRKSKSPRNETKAAQIQF